MCSAAWARALLAFWLVLLLLHRVQCRVSVSCSYLSVPDLFSCVVFGFLVFPVRSCIPSHFHIVPGVFLFVSVVVASAVPPVSEYRGFLSLTKHEPKSFYSMTLLLSR